MHEDQMTSVEASQTELVQALKEAHDEIRDLREQMAEMRWIETALRRRTGELGERVKELDCLFAIADCLRARRASLDAVLQAIADTIPSGYQAPGRTWVELFVFGRRFRSSEFRESTHTDSCAIFAAGRDAGRVRVFVLPLDPSAGTAAFLKEERALLRAVALWVGLIVEHRDANGMAWAVAKAVAVPGNGMEPNERDSAAL